ncbi:MAG: FAD-dependent oxidoreductase [Desulfobacterales bacterium]
MNSEALCGAVVVSGGGIGGIQASLDLAHAGYKVYLVERSPAIGGVMAQLDKTFPTNDCAMCIMSPKLVEVGRHPDIEILTLAEIRAVEGEPGRFRVTVEQKPRYIDLEKCIACGRCAEKCPKKVIDGFNRGLSQRRAAYVLHPQAVPLKYLIDESQCLYLQKKKCGACAKICPAGAVNFEDRARMLTLEAGAVIFSSGFEPFDPTAIDTLGYGRIPDVFTSLEFERLLAASGPTAGRLQRRSDGAEPRKIAWLQCIGSRDINRSENFYCSSVCCMYAIKQAIIAKEHADHPLEGAIFFMDMRTHGKGFEDGYNQARDRHGIRFVRSRVHTVDPHPSGAGAVLRYVGEDGLPHREEFDLVVLSIGLQSGRRGRQQLQELGIALTEGGFVHTDTFDPAATSRRGIYVCGALSGPKDIPQSVIEAESAALRAGADLAPARNRLTSRPERIPKRDLRGEPPRIGVFVCHCGINIQGVVDVPAVRDYARGLPGVVFAADNLYSCSQDTQNLIRAKIEAEGLNRVVIAACSPKTHEPLFQKTLADAGVNKSLLEFVNIRNQDSWVHREDPPAATAKAKELVRMAVAKAALLVPLAEEEIRILPRALVVGGGISGMAAARALSSQGYPVEIVEREAELGGQARFLHRTARGEEIQPRLAALIRDVENDPRISVHCNAELVKVEGFVGNFRSTIRQGPDTKTIEHGVAVLAPGARELTPAEYLYGEDPRVITGLELDRRLRQDPAPLSGLKRAVFIQCVGSREPARPYCSRLCCTHTMVSALELLDRHPETQVVVLYRDIRTYGEREGLYLEARRRGVTFIRYDPEDKPRVRATPEGLVVEALDPILGRRLAFAADLLVLAAAVVPYENEALARFFKVPVNADGFFVEAHVKLNPAAFATEGVFLCGLAHYPKPIDESIAQAQAAAAAATVLLARERLTAGGTTARVDPYGCSSCGVCLAVCPYQAPRFVDRGPFTGRAEIHSALCKGCGLCVASCRSGAIQLQGFTDAQTIAMIEAALCG